MLARAYYAKPLTIRQLATEARCNAASSTIATPYSFPAAATGKVTAPQAGGLRAHGHEQDGHQGPIRLADQLAF